MGSLSKDTGGYTMRIFKRITALALAAVTAGAMGLGAAAEADEPIDEEYIGGYTLEERVAWGIEDYAENTKTAFKLTYPEQEDVIDEIVDAIVSNDTFISIFEDDARAVFRIVEDSLRDALEPLPQPIAETDEIFYSKYNLTPIKQRNSDYNAAAATLMALVGSGVSEYIGKNTDTMQRNIYSNFNTNPQSGEVIRDITYLMWQKVPSTAGYAFQTNAFVTTAANAFDNMLTRLKGSLSCDGIPIIKIDDTKYLDYYKGTSLKNKFLVVTQVDILGECVTVYDPNDDSRYFGDHVIDFDRLEFLFKKSSVFWISGLAYDRAQAGLANVIKEYPAGTYFNESKTEACTCHSWCNEESSCSCTKYDGSSQCAGFARWVYFNVRGIVPSNVNRTYCNYKSTRTDEGKNILKGLSACAYVRVTTNYTWNHSVSVISTSSSGIVIYHANWDSPCKVTYEYLSWTEFSNRFPKIEYYID